MNTEAPANRHPVAQRRAGRPTGWVPWVALIVGTAASLAANVAVGGADPIGKALAGWPAISMLIAIKLLFSMIDHTTVDQRTAVRDDQWTSPTVPDVPGTVQRTGRDDSPPSRTVSTGRTNNPTGPDNRPAEAITVIAPAAVAAPAGSGDPGKRPAPVDVRTVTHLIPVARAARTTLARSGQSLSRDNLADALRDDGHGVSNARASLLLKVLKAEHDATMIGPPSHPVPSRAAPGLEPGPLVDDHCPPSLVIDRQTGH